MTKNNSTTKTRDLVVTRAFEAPIEFVWKAWTDPEYVIRWWGPDYFTSPSAKIDLREGGTSDPEGLFNAGLEAKATRAIDIGESDDINEEALKELIRSAVAFNRAGGKKK